MTTPNRQHKDAVVFADAVEKGYIRPGDHIHDNQGTPYIVPTQDITRHLDGYVIRLTDGRVSHADWMDCPVVVANPEIAS